VVLPGEVLTALLAFDDDEYHECSEDEDQAVAVHIAERIIAGIGCGDWAGSERLAEWLVMLLGDRMDSRVVSYLAGAMRE
jgi:hypothetical protein